jgi:hypothetical protein
MNFELKLRIYGNFDGKNQMIYCDPMEVNDNGIWFGWALNHLDGEPQEVKIMLPSGMVDKNGKEIWSDDKVLLNTKNGQPNHDWVMIVKFYLGKFILQPEGDEYRFPYVNDLDLWLPSICVIGNIYEQ